jgi:hypothetical protein
MASFTMNFLEQDYWAMGGDLAMLGLGKFGGDWIRNLRNKKGLINWTEQAVLESIFESSMNIGDGVRSNLQSR